MKGEDEASCKMSKGKKDSSSSTLKCPLKSRETIAAA